jgi:hypothetical protein
MSNDNTIKIDLSLDDINTILESLGQLPFARVYTLIARIQEQARAQLASQQGEQGETG